MKRDILRTIKKHVPTLLCMIASGGVVLTAVLAVKSTPKAMALLQKTEAEKGEALTTAEKVKTAAPCYIPAAVTGAVTMACIFGANVLNKKQQASLMSAYALLHTHYKRYTEKVRELCGDDMHKDILGAIAIEKADNGHPVVEAICGRLEDFNGTDEEKRLFYDAYSDRYFESTISHVLQAEYHLNRNFTLGANVTLNDFYLFLGISKIDGGDDIGWSWYDYELPWIDFENIPMKLEDGTPYHMITMVFGPEPCDMDVS